MPGEGKLQLTLAPGGRDGKAILSASYDGVAIYTAPVVIADPKSRDEFISAILSGRPGINSEDLRAEMEAIAAKAIEKAGESGRERATQADLLVQMADDAELFASGDAEYATISVEIPEPHRETYAIRERGFRDWLSRRYWQQFGRAVGSQAVQDATENLRAKAKYGGNSRPVAIRICQWEGKTYLDLANAKWEAVEIAGDGWRIVPDSPVRFIRKRGMRELPVPISGGKLEELRPLLNAADEETWVLLVAWLIGAFRHSGPYPILAVNGEQGSAKSTTCRMLRRLIDPNEADLRAAPREERDLLIAASNSWIVAMDNLSAIRPDMSDALCRLSTGGGFSTRELYADDAEKLFNVCRPQMFNGIEEIATRPDLLERCIVINLPAIGDEARQPEADLWAKYEGLRPQLLGALLDAVAAAIRNQGRVERSRNPRLADFAIWVRAAEPAIGWPEDTFVRAYESNRGQANQSAIEASPIAQAVAALVHARGSWSGSAKELLAALQEGEYADAKVRDRLGWPKTPKALSNEMRRVAPTLRRSGVEVSMGEREGRERKRVIRLERVGQTQSATSEPAPTADLEAETDVSADGPELWENADSPPDGPQTVVEIGETDGVDGADGMTLAQSAYSAGR